MYNVSFINVYKENKYGSLICNFIIVIYKVGLFMQNKRERKNNMINIRKMFNKEYVIYLVLLVFS